MVEHHGRGEREHSSDVPLHVLEDELVSTHAGLALARALVLHAVKEDHERVVAGRRVRMAPKVEAEGARLLPGSVDGAQALREKHVAHASRALRAHVRAVVDELCAVRLDEAPLRLVRAAKGQRAAGRVGRGARGAVIERRGAATG